MMALAGMRIASPSAARMAHPRFRFPASPRPRSSGTTTSRIVRRGTTLGDSNPPRKIPTLPPRAIADALPFSTSVAKSAKAIPDRTLPAVRGFRWRIVARAAQYLRIPFLVLSVYKFGYQQGIADYSRDPAGKESELLDSSLSAVGCTDPEEKEKVLIARQGERGSLVSRVRSDLGVRDEATRGRMVMLTRVGDEIVKTAQSYVKGKLAEAVEEATSRLPPEVLEDRNRLYQALVESEDVELWTKAQRRMEGSWQYVLVPSQTPNAFVSEILPRRIFVTASFFEDFVESQDELALVLGHEISHLILGHASERNWLETSLRTVEILLLSLDPTEGLLSLAFMALLASARHALGAVHSREHERQADGLGIRLAAMACYDTRAASRVFRKMHLRNVESGGGGSSGGLTSFFDSHPPSEERFLALLEESDRENREKYEETSCREAKTMFWNAMKPG